MDKLNELCALLESSLEIVSGHIDFCEECEHYSERDYWVAYSSGLRDALDIVERLNSKTQKEVEE
jgi:NMD protein affecting ribosome stability and mRNA decay